VIAGAIFRAAKKSTSLVTTRAADSRRGGKKEWTKKRRKKERENTKTHSGGFGPNDPKRSQKKGIEKEYKEMKILPKPDTSRKKEKQSVTTAYGAQPRGKEERVKEKNGLIEEKIGEKEASAARMPFSPATGG